MSFLSKLGATATGAIGTPILLYGGSKLYRDNFDQTKATFDAFSETSQDKDNIYTNDIAAGIGAASMEAYAQAASEDNGYLGNLAITGVGAGLVGLSAAGFFGDSLEDLAKRELEE